MVIIKNRKTGLYMTKWRVCWTSEQERAKLFNSLHGAKSHVNNRIGYKEFFMRIPQEFIDSDFIVFNLETFERTVLPVFEFILPKVIEYLKTDFTKEVEKETLHDGNNVTFIYNNKYTKNRREALLDSIDETKENCIKVLKQIIGDEELESLLLKRDI